MKRLSAYLDPPISFEGKVIQGYGRGSKELQCPTANIEMEEIPLPNGLYWGYASTETDKCMIKCAINVGVCPFYNNSKQSFEVHLLKEYEEDFYGIHLSGIVVGFIRPESNFESVEQLKEAIQGDLEWISSLL